MISAALFRSGPPAAPLAVNNDAAWPSEGAFGSKGYDYRSLKGILKEIHSMPP
jgi:hypothetical protein